MNWILVARARQKSRHQKRCSRLTKSELNVQLTTGQTTLVKWPFYDLIAATIIIIISFGVVNGDGELCTFEKGSHCSWQWSSGPNGGGAGAEGGFVVKSGRDIR